jgi:hypothetical protein
MPSDALDRLLSDPYVPTAVYFPDSDCVEYVREDTICVYDRVDEFLTLVFDETRINLIGFKFKGFRNIFETHLRSAYHLNNDHFIEMIEVLTAVCTALGNKLTSDKRRKDAYRAVKKLATKDNIKIYDLSALAA